MNIQGNFQEIIHDFPGRKKSDMLKTSVNFALA